MIKPYTIEDKQRLLELLRFNTPDFFDKSEEKDFVEYLEKHAQNYFVVEVSGVIVGCGGFNLGFEEGKTARISWDIIHPDFKGKGIGGVLIEYRINEIRKMTGVKNLIVRTTQFSNKFYEKQGFKLKQTEKDFWAKGFDLYEMEMVLEYEL